MLKLGIIGYPLEHTLSPVMHTAALQQLNINGEYKAYEIKEENLEREFKKLVKSGITGLSVTIPFKTKIIPLLDSLTETARLIGAINTLRVDSSGLTTGENTDAKGFYDSIPKRFKSISDKTVTVLGCGGSARAICIAFLLNKVRTLKVYGRNPLKLKEFEKFLLGRKEKLSSKTSLSTSQLDKLDLEDTFILVNTTPCGMYPKINDTPVKKEKLAELPEKSLVYDIIYNPKETRLLKNAKELNLKTLNGIEMLARQGASSLSFWLGKDISAMGVMRLAVENSL